MKPPLVFQANDGARRVLVPGVTAEFFVGLDLGQAHDSTALCVVEKRSMPGEPDRFGIRHLQTWLGEPYPALVDHVVRILARPPLDLARSLIIDRTGVGRPVYDLFRQAGLDCGVVGVTITAADQAHSDGGAHWVPKRDLVSVAQVLLMERRLEIAAGLPDAERLATELRDFRVSISAAGHDSYSAREGKHDDILLASCLALWGAQRNLGRFEAW